MKKSIPNVRLKSLNFAPLNSPALVALHDINDIQEFIEGIVTSPPFNKRLDQFDWSGIERIRELILKIIMMEKLK